MYVNLVRIRAKFNRTWVFNPIGLIELVFPSIGPLPCESTLCIENFVLKTRFVSKGAMWNRSESLRAGLWVPCQILWASCGPALGPNLV